MSAANIKTLCKQCTKVVKKNHRAIQCDACNDWVHMKCASLSAQDYVKLGSSSESWFCICCLSQIFPFMSLDQTEFKDVVVSNFVNYVSPTLLNVNVKNFFKDDILEDDPIINLVSECKYYDITELASLAQLKDNIACIHINVRSVAANFEAVSDMFESLNNAFDFIILTEAWIDNSNSNLYSLPNYTSFSFPRCNKKGGGIIIFIKNAYLAQACPSEIAVSSFEYGIVRARNKFNGDIFVICGIYKPPNSNLVDFVEEFGSFCDHYVDDSGSFKDDFVFFAGDFNINLLRYGKNAIVSKFLDNAYANGLFPSIFLPTRITSHSSTLIDNIFVNQSSYCCNGLIKYDISDHFPVFVVLNYSASVSSKSGSTYQTVLTRPLPQHVLDKLNASLKLENWNFINDNTTVNEDYDKFASVITNAVNKYAPLKPDRNINKHNFKKAWMTPGLLNSIHQKERMYRSVLAGKTPIEYYKQYKNRLCVLIRTRKQTYYNSLVNRHIKDVRTMWQIINESVNKSKNACDNSAFCNMDVNDLNNFFVNLGPDAVKNVKPRGTYKQYLRNRIINSFFIENVTPDEIIAVSKLIQSKLSCGHDGLSMKLIKGIIDSISVPLAKIFSKSFSSGCFPDALKIARIVPIFKSGDNSDLKNYRPISLLPSISKLIEKLMLTRLAAFLQKHDVINKHQHGFRRNHSTSTALADVLDYITLQLDKKLSVFALFVDIAKAFDSLSHDILLAKLEHYGIRGVALDWFSSYLLGRFQYTEINGRKSLFKSIISGVPQGSVLGPYLYLIYANDIFYLCPEAKCVLFADDSTILTSNDDIESLVSQSCDIYTKFSVWFADNRLALNSKKTKFMLFSLCKLEAPKVLNFDVHTVENVLSVRYLGFILDTKLRWHEHILHVNDKVAKGIGLLKFCKSFLPQKCLLSMYYAFVYPYLIYGLEHWGCASKTLLINTTVLQKKCIRLLSNADMYAHVAPLAKSANLLLFNDLYRFCVLRIMCKVYLNICCAILSEMFTRINVSHSYNTRSCKHNFFFKTSRINVRKLFIRNNGAKLWNNMKLDLYECKTVKLFHVLLKSNILSCYV